VVISCEHDNGALSSIKDGEFLNQLSGDYVLSMGTLVVVDWVRLCL
jgi:hypothetical protein